MILFALIWSIFGILSISIDTTTTVNAEICPTENNYTGYNQMCLYFMGSGDEDEVFEPSINCDCDIDQHMECTNVHYSLNPLIEIDRCRCSSGYEYDIKFDKCQGTVGRFCNPNADNECVATMECIAPEENSMEGRCTCREGLVQSGTKCYFKLGEPCNSTWSDDPCGLSNYHSVCQSGTCQCSSNYFYDKSREICVPKIGTKCFQFGPCGYNAMCDILDGCECYSEHEPDYDGENCFKKIRQSCSNTSECGHFLTCDNGKCECPDDFILGGHRNERCSVPAGKSCTRDEECVKYSTCQNSTCTCDRLFYPGASGECFGRQGCWGDALICDDFGHFTCKDDYDYCGCKDGYHMYFNDQCRGLYSSGCTEKVENDCIGKLQCLNSSCTCPPGHQVDSWKQNCLPTLGMNCTNTNGINPCSQSMNLECINGQCTCDSDEYFDYQTNKCSGKLGSICGSNYECGARAVCRNFHCECADSTLIPDRNKTVCINTNPAFHPNPSIISTIIVIFVVKFL